MTKEGIRKFSKRSLPLEIKLAAKSGQDKKGEGICVLDLRDLSAFTDFFVIMHGNSSRQNLALYEGVEEALKGAGVRPLSVEGRGNAEWILMDYGFFLVHIFSGGARDRYALEKLWGDAPRIDY